MKTKTDSEPKLILKIAFIKYYEFIPVSVYLFFLSGLFWEGFNIILRIIMAIIGVVMIAIGVKRLLDNKPKVIIDSKGIKLTDENIELEWNQISDIEIGAKTVQRFNSYKSVYDSTVNVKSFTIYTTKNKKIEKIIEKYRFSKKQLNSVFQFYIEKNKTTH